jgi:hypothetical protein
MMARQDLKLLYLQECGSTTSSLAVASSTSLRSHLHGKRVQTEQDIHEGASPGSMQADETFEAASAGRRFSTSTPV